MDKNNIINFLECYEKHPCLWNPRENDYRNNNSRLAALKAIINEMGLNITVENLKAKIKNIRTTYNREVSKIVASKKSGAGADDIYKPQLIWFSTADRFLKPVIEGRVSKDNMIKDKDKIEVNNDAAAASDSSSYFKDLDQSDSVASYVVKKKKLSNPKTLRANKIVPSLSVSEAVHKLESIAQNVQQDEFDTFGQHVANQLRNIPILNAIKSQKFINNYLAQERINVLISQRRFTPSPNATPDIIYENCLDNSANGEYSGHEENADILSQAVTISSLDPFVNY